MDLLLLFWALGGFIWLAVLSVERGLESTADAAQEKLRTITLIAVPWFIVLIIVGIPFVAAAMRYHYEPFWFNTLQSWL